MKVIAILCTKFDIYLRFYLYICTAVGGAVIQEGNVRNPTTFFGPELSQELDFQRHMSWSVLCSVS